MIGNDNIWLNVGFIEKFSNLGQVEGRVTKTLTHSCLSELQLPYNLFVYCCPSPLLFILEFYQPIKNFFYSTQVNKFNATCFNMSFVKLKCFLPSCVGRPAKRNKACLSVATCCCSSRRS